MSEDGVANCRRCGRVLAADDPYINVHRDGVHAETICIWCGKEEAMADYARTGEITTRLMTDAVICKSRMEAGADALAGLRDELIEFYQQHSPALLAVARDAEEIEALAREFEARHWLPTLQAYYRASDVRGHNAQGDGWEALLWGSAGRVLLTLQCKGKFGGAWATMIFDETSPVPRGGVQGLCATKGEAVGLLRAAMDGMPPLRSNGEVTLAGI